MGMSPDQADALAVGIGFQGGPLAVEEELDGLEVIAAAGQAPAGVRQSGGLPATQRVGPAGQPGLALLLLDGHEEGVVLQPGALLLAERLVRRGRGGEQPAGRLLEDGGPLGVQQVVPDGAGGLGGGQLLPGQQALLRQQVKVDEIGVARKGGKTLVGAVPITGGTDGQDLPVGLPGLGQKIHKTVGLAAQGADAVRPRQAEHRHQDAACTHRRSLPQPLTAPAMTPSMMYFWQATYRMMMGTMAMMMQAIMGASSTRP